MKNFLLYIIVSSAISVTSGLVYAKYYLSPKVKDWAQTKASEVLGAPVQIRDLRVLILPKLSLAATGIKFSKAQPNIKVEIARVFIDAPINKSLFSRTLPFGPIHIRIEEPKISLETVTTPPKVETKKDDDDTVAVMNNTIKISYSRDIILDTDITNAKIRFLQVSPTGEIENETSLDPLNLNIHIPGIESDWTIALKAQLRRAHPQLSLPIDLSGDVSLKDQKISATGVKGEVSGIQVSLAGEQNLNGTSANWKLIADVPDFAKVKNQPHFFESKNWLGGLHAELSAFSSLDNDWQYIGTLALKTLSTEIKFEKDDLHLDGSVKVDLDTKVSYGKSLRIDHFTLHTNLDDFQISKPDIFLKPKATPLSLNVSLNGQNEILTLIDFTMSYLNLKAFANGTISLSKDASSEMNIHIDPTQLTGFEKNFLTFSKSSLSGQLQMDSTLKGNPEKGWSLDLHPLKLDKLKGPIDYTAVDHILQFSGIMDLSGELRGLYDFEAGFKNSALTVNGISKLNFTNFQYQSAQSGETEITAKDAAPPTPTSKTTENLVWPLLKLSKFQINAQTKQLRFNHVSAENVASNILLADQVLKGTLYFGQIDSGEISISNVSIDFKKPNPEVEGHVDATKIDANQLISSFDLGSTDLIRGEITGQSNFNFPYASTDEPLSRMKATGKATLKSATFSSRQIDDVINEKLSQIPGLGKVKTTPAQSNVGSEVALSFSLLDSVLNILDFKLSTPAKNEVQAKGTLALRNQALNLAGTAYLSDAPIGGDIRAANSDAQGRFMVPYILQGTIKSPEASFPPRAIEDIIKKTMYHVVKRETGKFKKTAPEATPAPVASVAPAAVAADPDDVEEQEPAEDQPTAKEVTPVPTPTPKPAVNKVEEFKNRLQGIFDKHD